MGRKGNCARTLKLTIRTMIYTRSRIRSGNEMHKILRDFEMETDHLISTRRPDPVIVNKKTCRIEDFASLVDFRVQQRESEKRDKFLET